MSALFAIAIGFPIVMHADDHPRVVKNFVDEAKKNSNWKSAVATGEEEQVVLMNISPITNPKNEIGMETHPFDQVILVIEGRGKATLDGETENVEEGDMIFIPKGTKHNVVNLNKTKPLKIISFYSQTDIPEGSKIKKKEHESED